MVGRSLKRQCALMVVRELTLRVRVDQRPVRQDHNLVPPDEVALWSRVDGLFCLPRQAAIDRAGKHRLGTLPLERGCLVESGPRHVDVVRVDGVGGDGRLVIPIWTPAISIVARGVDTNWAAPAQAAIRRLVDQEQGIPLRYSRVAAGIEVPVRIEGEPRVSGSPAGSAGEGGKPRDQHVPPCCAAVESHTDGITVRELVHPDRGDVVRVRGVDRHVGLGRHVRSEHAGVVRQRVGMRDQNERAGGVS